MKPVKSFFILALLLLVVSTVFAQPQRGPNPERNLGILSPEVSEALGLTTLQKGQIVELQAEHQKKMQAFRAEFRQGDVTPNQMRQRQEALMAQHDEDLKKILSPAQFEQLTKIRAERRAQMRENRGNSQNRGYNRGQGGNRSDGNRQGRGNPNNR